MKKTFIAMMLVSGISTQAFAQKSPNPSLFEIPEGSFSNRYMIDLGRGNLLQIELSEPDDIRLVENTDSILEVFFKDMEPFRDSLKGEMNAKRIDYLADAAGRKKIRIQSFKPIGNTFVLRQGEVAALKTEQDSVNIIGTINGAARRGILKPTGDVRYYRLRFFVNDIDDLRSYREAKIGEKVTAIKAANRSQWSRNSDGVWRIAKADKTISAQRPAGSINGAGGDYLTLLTNVNVENYKNFFVPSATLGVSLVFNNGRKKTGFSAAWEPHFLFAADASGKLQTYRNDFITLYFNQSRTAPATSKVINFNPNFSVSYLKKQRGGFFNDKTFRLGTGQVSLFNEMIKIEPGIYFTNLFKGVTPSLKLSVTF